MTKFVTSLGQRDKPAEINPNKPAKVNMTKLVTSLGQRNKDGTIVEIEICA